MLRLLFLLLLISLTSGCATVNGQPPEEHDPLERFNRSVYRFNDAVDRAVLKPVAQTYEEYTPDPVNRGISNFFSNLDDVLVTLNDLLQAKPGQAASDFSRLIWNSTVGVFGLIDVATPLGLPKHEEDFGQTLGHWGVGPGPYLVLPFLGPSTVRDGSGTVAYWYTDPLRQSAADGDEYWGAVGVRVVDRRAELLRATNLLEQAALDPYVFTREAYLQYRRNQVYDGHPPLEFDPFEDMDEDEAFDPFAEPDDAGSENPEEAPAP